MYPVQNRPKASPIVVDQEDDDVGESAEESVTLGSGELYSGSHSQLRWGSGNAKQAVKLAAGRDPGAELGSKFNAFTSKHGGQFSPIFKQQVDAKAREAIASYAARRS